MATNNSVNKSPMPSGAVVGDTDTQTLTNKTLTSPQIGTGLFNNSNQKIITFSTGVGSQVNFMNFASATTGDSPMITADGSDTNVNLLLGGKGTGQAYAGISGSYAPIVNTTGTQTLTNKTISGSSNTLSNIGNAALSNSAITIAGTSTSLGGSITQDTITGLSSTGLVKRTGANTLATVTAPSGAVVGDTDTQTLTNKTLTSPIISSISNTGTLTLPTSTDTLVGRATTDTLTNKDLSSSTNTFPGWATYSPTWAGSSINPAIGNGTLYGAYVQIGKTVIVYVSIQPGSTTTFGSGFWTISLPVTAASSGKAVAGHGSFQCSTHSGGANFNTANAYLFSTSAMVWEVGSGMRANVDATHPFTWANGDSFYGTFTYQAA